MRPSSHLVGPRLALPGANDQRAFTLVEVTLAIGIASFALLVLFSLMPTGLASLQDTGRQIVETEIFNKISSELATTPLYRDYAKTDDALGDYQTSRFPAYFDVEGNELGAKENESGVKELTAADKAKTVFTVELVSPDKAMIPNATWRPSPGDGKGELRWGKVRIGFRCKPGSTDVTMPNVVTRTFLLSNNGI